MTNQAIPIHARPMLFRSPWVLSCGLAFAFGTTVLAQSATSFDTGKLVPTPPPTNAAVKKTISSAPAADESQPSTAGPSRFVAPADLDAYVQSLASMLSIRNRGNDPFGQLQDPDAKPIVKPTIAKTSRRVAPARITPFTEIVSLIQVTTVMPAERRFLIGTRSFKQGDRFPMNFRGRTIKVEIARVTSQRIDFQSLDDGETASISLNLMPVGMKPGNSQITTPGMVRDRADSPLEIEAGNSFTDNSQN